MSAPTEPRLGLRERKKIKLRRAVQTEALRLFQDRGYDQTTVEQIADAAEISTTTFYRYFPTKEDAILDDDADALTRSVMAGRPADEPLVATVRATFAAVAAEAEGNREHEITRLRLVTAVPALTARYAAEERQTINLLVELLGARTGRDADDYQLNLTAAALVAVLFTASNRWAAVSGETPLPDLIDEAVGTISPLLTAL